MKFFTRRKMRSITRGMDEKKKQRAMRERITADDGRVRQSVVRMLCPNLDRIVVVGSVKEPPLRCGLIDRILALAELERTEALIVVNKVDLDRPEAEQAARVYRQLGYSALCASTLTGEGIDELRGRLQGRSALAGHSGVGKSSLLGALAPAVAPETGAVSLATNKGQHTTTSIKLYRLEWGEIFDLPGLKLAPLDCEPEELSRLFVEFSACRCRFRDCLHKDEPGCGVREAVQNGSVYAERYESYLRILGSLG